MSGFRWTKQQEEAITVTGRETLVAAGAGTGKTAVLVERVIRLITRRQNPLSVDQLLVVTYTDAAAGEMRHRIAEALSKALTKEPDSSFLRRQLSLLPKARITTIHSFCLSVVRRYFHRLGLDPSFRVLDPHEAELLQLDVADQLLEEALQNPEGYPGFTTLLDHYGGTAGDNLIDLILHLHAEYTVQDDPENWLQKLTAAFQAAQKGQPSPLTDSLRELVSFRLQQGVWNLQQSAALCLQPGGPDPYYNNITAEQKQLAAVEQLTRQDISLEDLLNNVRLITFERLPRAPRDTDEELKKRVTNLRDRTKKIVNDLLSQLASQSTAGFNDDLADLLDPMAALTSLVKEFDAAFRRAKEAVGGVDFSDLERFCLDLLRPPQNPQEVSQVAVAVGSQFREIIVDEYQDINPAQEAILQLVAAGGQGEAKPNRFAVGDVKQSIYRFRLAEPGIFLNKYNTFAREPGGENRRIDLQSNFRSRQNILNTVNYVFRQLFTADSGELGYDRSAWLEYGAGYPVESEDPVVELHVLERDNNLLSEGQKEQEGDELDKEQAQPSPPYVFDYTADQREALLVTRRIKELLQNGRVWDRKKETMRPVTLKDIAILMRSPRHRANSFVEILGRAGIPVAADLTTGYFDAVEVATVLSLLQIIDNPRQDIPLAAVLHSPLVGLDVNDLARIKLAAPSAGADFHAAVYACSKGDSPLGRRLADFLKQLDRWRTLARRGRLADLLWSIYDETNYLAYVGGLPDGQQRRANLLALHQRARNFDGFARRGLFRFLRFIERLREEGQDLGAPPPGDAGEEAVRLMSIHRSKGLEFPIVFLCDLGRDMNVSALKKPILVHRRLGLGPNVVVPEQGVSYPSQARYALRHELHKEAVAEEMRVLYVAMTRAREQLIMIGSVADVGENCLQWGAGAGLVRDPLPDPFLTTATRPLDWLAATFARHRVAGEPLRDAALFAPALANEQLAQAPIRCRVQLWDGPAVQQLCRPDATLRPTASVARGDKKPVADGGAESKIRWTEKLDWVSPYRPLADKYAKVRATQIEREPSTRHDSWAELEEGAGSLVPRATAENITEEPTVAGADGKPAAAAARARAYLPPLPRPRFLQDEGRVTPLERGSAAHLILQHVNLVPAPGESALRQTADDLVNRGLLTQAAAQAVDLTGLVGFFRSSLGRQLTGAAARNPQGVAREIPFSLRLPARQAYPELDAERFQGEWVLVQGIIDCLYETEEGIVLIDFKTDRIKQAGIEQAVEFYRDQLTAYAQAARHLYDRPLAGAYLYFLTPGQGVRLQ